MKRITWWPQAWLGLVFSWGALVGWPAVTGSLVWPPFLLWFGSIAWVIGYDTLYAIQDIEDDALVGVKSSARRLGDKAPLGIAIFYALALLLWGAAIWTVRPDWLALLALAPGGAPSRQPGAARRPRATASSRCGCSAPTAPAACSSSSRCWSSAFPRARRARHAIARRRPPASPNPSSSAASPPARPPPTRSMSASARRASRCASASSRASAAPKARRSGCGCSSASARRPSPRPTCRTRRSASWSSAAWRWRGKRPKTPMPGSPRTSCCSAASCRALDSGDRREPDPAELRARALEAEKAALAVAGVTNSSGAGASASASTIALATSGGFSGAYRDDRPRLLGGGDRGRRRDDAARPCLAQRAPSRGPRRRRRDRPPRRRARRRAAQPDAAQARQISGAVRPARLVDACSAISPARSPARRSRARRASCRTSSGDAVFARGRDDRRRSAAPARAALAPVRRRRACASSRQELVADGVLNSWIAESASARQLGIAPTGHAARGVGGAPGAAPSNLYHGSRARAAARSCSRPFPKRCWSIELIGQGVNGGHRRLQPRRGRLHGPRRRDRRAGRRDHHRLEPDRHVRDAGAGLATSSSAAASTRRRSSFPK